MVQRVRARVGAAWRDDAGSAVAESAMVYALLALLFFTVLQGGLIVHTRNVLIDAASAGARFGALADRTPADGAERTAEVIAATVPGQSGATVSGTVQDRPDGPVVVVTVRTQLPALGFLPGPVDLEVHGHAFQQ